MTIGEQGLALVKKFEGFYPTRYICPGRKPTIGYGHVIEVGEEFGSLTEAGASALLEKDLRIAALAVEKKVSVHLCQHMADALISFVFNIGAGAFGKSTLLRLLNAGDYAGAAGQFGRWINAGGKPLAGLVRRREAERKLFLGEK